MVMNSSNGGTVIGVSAAQFDIQGAQKITSQ